MYLHKGGPTGGMKRLPALRKSMAGIFVLLMTLAFVACEQSDASSAATQATAVAGVIATIEAQPTSPPVVQTVIVVASPGPTATPIVVMVVATPEPTAIPAATATPAPTATPRVITIIATPEPTATSVPVPAPQVLDTSASVREDNSLIVNVDITLDRAARVLVEYSNADAGTFRTAVTEVSSKDHVVPVVRLRAETTYSYTAIAVDSDGQESPGAVGTFVTGGLPDQLAAFTITATGKPTSELLLMDVRDNTATFLVIMDDDANIVWYHQTPNVVEGVGISMNAIKQKRNYNFVFYAGSPRTPCCLREITPLGEQVDELVYSSANLTPHHDFLILSDDEVMYLADVPTVVDDSPNGGAVDQAVVADSIRIWDQRTGQTREVWNSLDFWDPSDINEREQFTGNPVRWMHINSITLGPRGNYILSARNRNQIISLSKDFQTIEWRIGLGNEGSPRSDFEFPDPEDRFYRSHTASQLTNGNLLIFDNGATRPEEEGGQYSRALELEIDDYDMIAVKVWEYRHDPDVYARNISSASRLENQNTLINFGNRDDITSQPTVAVEVTKDGTEVWHLEMVSETSKGRFRVYAQGTIMGEVKLASQ